MPTDKRERVFRCRTCGALLYEHEMGGDGLANNEHWPEVNPQCRRRSPCVLYADPAVTPVRVRVPPSAPDGEASC